MENWDFLESTETYGELYWISKYLPEGNTVAVLDPVGRNQVMEKCIRLWIPFKTIYLDISPELQRLRLEERRMSVIDIRTREKDFDWFDKTKFCLSINWDNDIKKIADEIERQLFTK